MIPIEIFLNEHQSNIGAGVLHQIHHGRLCESDSRHEELTGGRDGGRWLELASAARARAARVIPRRQSTAASAAEPGHSRRPLRMPDVALGRP